MFKQIHIATSSGGYGAPPEQVWSAKAQRGVHEDSPSKEHDSGLIDQTTNGTDLQDELQDAEQVFFTDLLSMINEGLETDALFGTAEATAACEVMGEANELMLSEGIVYKI